MPEQKQHHIIQERPADLAQLLWKNLALEIPADLGVVSMAVGLDVEFARYPSNLAGCYVRLPTGVGLIILNQRLPAGRIRFTWAHEIGHHLLVDTAAAVSTIERRQGAADPAEVTCDAFAANLLMPENLIISCINALHQSSPRDRVRAVAEAFRVSHHAVLRRAEEVGQLDALFHPLLSL